MKSRITSKHRPLWSRLNSNTNKIQHVQNHKTEETNPRTFSYDPSTNEYVNRTRVTCPRPSWHVNVAPNTCSRSRFPNSFPLFTFEDSRDGTGAPLPPTGGPLSSRSHKSCSGFCYVVPFRGSHLKASAIWII